MPLLLLLHLLLLLLLLLPQTTRMMGLLDGLVKPQGDPVRNANADLLTSYEARVKRINDIEESIEELSDDELRQGLGNMGNI